MTVTKDRIWTRDFTLACLLGLATMMTFQLLIPTIPRYVLHIGGTNPDAGYSMAIFSIFALASRILSGWMVDRYGQKLPAIVGAVLFVAVAPLYMLVEHLPALLALRALHGVGFGFLTNAIYSLGADLAPPKRRGEALGHLTNMATLSSAIAPATAATLMGLTAFALTGFDLVFLLCVVMAVIGLGSVLWISETRTERDLTPRGMGGLLDIPTIPLATVSTLVQFAMGGVFSFVPLYLPVSSLPIFYLAYAAALLFIRPTIGRIGDRIDRRKLIPPMLLLAAVGLAVLALGTSVPIVLASALLFGTGFGAVQPTMTAIVVDRTPPARRGTALATFTSSFDIGVAAGATTLGLVSQWFSMEAVFLGGSLSILIGLAYFMLYVGPRSAPPAPAGA